MGGYHYKTEKPELIRKIFSKTLGINLDENKKNTEYYI